MTLQLALPVDMQRRLADEAQRSGLPEAAVALRILDQHLPIPSDAKRSSALKMIQQWMSEDAALSPEESASNLDLLRQLDQDRPSHRKLFVDLDGDQRS